MIITRLFLLKIMTKAIMETKILVNLLKLIPNKILINDNHFCYQFFLKFQYINVGFNIQFIINELVKVNIILNVRY